MVAPTPQAVDRPAIKNERVFVDTAAWIVLLDADDALHATAERVWHYWLAAIAPVDQ